MVRHNKNYKKKEKEYHNKCGGLIHWVTERVITKPVIRRHEGYCEKCKVELVKTYWSYKDEMIQKYLDEHGIIPE